MKNIILFTIIILSTLFSFAQNQDANLQKYWHYRERLRKDFIAISDRVMDQGVNIPASDRYVNDTILSWGDANNNMGHYLGVLATELWLLKNNNQDYSNTVKELFYAMMAMERLDAFSESNFRWYKRNNYNWIDRDNNFFFVYPADINGFSLRNDITESFWQNYKYHFNIKKFQSVFTIDKNDRFMEENSQDVIYHTMFGLALVAKLTVNESVSGIPCAPLDLSVLLHLTDENILTLEEGVSLAPKSVDFSKWAKDIIKRYINYIQSQSSYTYGFVFEGEHVGLTTHWILMNPILSKLVQEGNGVDAGSQFGTDLLSWGILKIGENIVGENLRKYESQLPVGYYNAGLSLGQLGLTNSDLILTVTSVGNYLDNQTFRILRNSWRYKIWKYEHLPLINLVLYDPDYKLMQVHDTTYNADKIIYEKLLNIDPGMDRLQIVAFMNGLPLHAYCGRKT